MFKEILDKVRSGRKGENGEEGEKGKCGKGEKGERAEDVFLEAFRSSPAMLACSQAEWVGLLELRGNDAI